MAIDMEIQSLITDSDKHRGIFHLYKVIYASFLLNCHIFKGLVLAI